MSNTAQPAGKHSQVVQSYGTESLLDVSPLIRGIREYHLRPGRGERPLFKQIQQYPETDEIEIGTGLLSPGILSKLYGKKSASIRKVLIDRDYCRPVDANRCILTWKFRTIGVEDFNIGMSDRAAMEIHRSLDALLWKPLPDGPEMDAFLDAINGGGEGGYSAAYRIGETEFWFRQGNSIIAFSFTQSPSPELIELIDHKLQVIQQEKMQNYFHIISSYNADSSMWDGERDRSGRFFEIIGQLITYTWRPFDMEVCEVSIDAAGDEALVASGSLRVDFTELGASASRFDRMVKKFTIGDGSGKEFVVNDMALRAADASGNASMMSLRMVSRTAGNVDPRRNILTHRFVKHLNESVGKLIDVIIPVMRREEAVQDLKWKSFLDTLRLQSLEYGEDLHRIVTESLRVLGRFFGISDVRVFSEDREIGHMLELFARSDISEKLYVLIDNPLSPADILKRQMVVFPIREIRGGRILLYFEMPRTGNRPLNPEIPDQYLMGTDLWHGVNEEAMLLGITDLKDYLFFIVTECITANPKAVMENLSRRLPVRGDIGNVENFMKLSRIVLARYSRFFDLFGTLSGNLESGLAYMRGRRDNLTGLYNRQHFTALLNESFSRPNYKFGLMFIDMDNFKIFNDAVSHDFGDKLLSSLANRMIDCADSMKDAVPGRFGGDEFCYSMGNIETRDFEQIAIRVFKSITEAPLVVSFYLDDRSEGEGMEINMIAFLHRLMRPDVGSRQASRTEYVEKPHMGPRSHVVDIWKHYHLMDGKSPTEGKVKAECIIDEIGGIIEDKILYNKIFPEIDEEISRIIRLFIALQLKDQTTNRIRDHLINDVGTLSVERNITLKVSAGLAHSTEHRLRSMDSLFKAADSRAYLAKHNGRNCLFGIDGQRLA